MKSAALLICCLGAVVAVEGSGACPSSELREYVPVGDKCYSVPGLPFQTDFYTSSEFCSVLSGDLFHVVNRSQWVLLNSFLVDTLGYTDTYWTGISSQGHADTWVVRSTGQELDPSAVEFKKGAPSGNSDNLCLAVEYQKDLGRYQFVDYPCTNQYVIVCQPKQCL